MGLFLANTSQNVPSPASLRFHHPNPLEELELNVSAGAWFEKAKTFYD